ncbi:MAG: ABC transporter substrate-binding protein [bacterium]
MKGTSYSSIIAWLTALFICLFPLTGHGSGARIAMFLWSGETKAEEGFRDVLAEEFPEQAPTYTLFDVTKDMDCLERHLEDFDEIQYDLIYTFGSKVTSEIAGRYTKPPIVFDIVFDPVGYGIIESWDMKQPNLTGASNAVPADIQIEKMREVFGEGAIGFIYNPADEKSVQLKEAMERYLEQAGSILLPFEFRNNFRPLRSYLERVSNQAVCIYLPSEWSISKYVSRIISEGTRRKIPTCVTSISYLRKKALLCISAEYYNVGRMAGALAARILKGDDPADLPVRRPSATDVKLYINSSTAKRLRMQFPPELDVTYIK